MQKIHRDLKDAHAAKAALQQELKVAKDVVAETRQRSDSLQKCAMEPNNQGSLSETPSSVRRCRQLLVCNT